VLLRVTCLLLATGLFLLLVPVAPASDPLDLGASTPSQPPGAKPAPPGPLLPGTRTLRHGEFVPALLFTPDGKALISAGSDKLIRLWDPALGREQRRISGHEAAVLSLSLTADGRTLASGSSDQTARLWDLASGKEQRRFTGHRGDVASVALSPDGAWLAASASGSVGEYLAVRRGPVCT
jgi:WD40 repeat protein